MKKVMFLLAVGVMCLTACVQKKTDERGPRQGGHMEINKDADSAFVALKNETLKKFKQLIFNDEQTGKTMEYNLLVPEGYDGTASYPLVLFMADASTVGKEVTAPLTQGYGALEFASDRDQQLHPSFVLVPQYTDWAVQDDWSITDEVEMTIRLLEQPVTYGGNLITIVEGCHVLHGLARFGKYASCLPLDEVDVAATSYQLLGQSLLLFAGELSTPRC